MGGLAGRVFPIPQQILSDQYNPGTGTGTAILFRANFTSASFFPGWFDRKANCSSTAPEAAFAVRMPGWLVFRFEIIHRQNRLLETT
jgi:hypothetical protein